MKYRLTVALVFFLVTLGCMDPAKDYGECKAVEIARCELRRDCQKLDKKEFSKRFPGFDYDTCVTYARQHCRTREIGQPNSAWEDSDVDNCVDAILAIYPDGCDSLERGIDETIAENGLLPPGDAGVNQDAGPASQTGDQCWFLKRPAKTEDGDGEE